MWRWPSSFVFALVAAVVVACGPIQAATTTAPIGTPSSVVTTTTMPTTMTTPVTTTTLPPATAGTSAEPGFAHRISHVTEEDLLASWRPGCPLDLSELRAVDVTYWGYDSEVHNGRLIVATELAGDVVEIMHDLFDASFPIERIEPIDVYQGDDERSMAANNTSAFNCRLVTGGTSWSEHSYGRAIDVNPVVNPYIIGSTVLPPEGEAYADRSLDAPGMIHAGDEVVEAFAARGWKWGGYWDSPTDYQHFSTTGH